MMEILLPEETGCTLPLPDPALLAHYEQLDKRIFWVDFEIDSTLLELTKKIILWNAEDRNVSIEDRIPIKVCIFSPGGSLAETMHACSIFQMSKTPIYTINMGLAMSGGFMLLVAGHKGHRYTLPFARAMTHNGSGFVGGTAGQAKDAMDDYQSQIDEMTTFILQQTEISKQQLSRRRDRDWYMDAKDQLKYGAVDKIITDIGEII